MIHGLSLRLRYWLLLVAVTPLTGQITKVYVSSDHVLRAVLTNSQTGESLVQIRNSQGQVLASREYRSEDGEHGGRIAHVAWTADSQFFVASIVASGGHQPWARPLWVYSRASDRAIELSNLGVDATGDFTLKAPDIVVTTEQCSGGDRPLHFSLHRLMQAGRLPGSPCPSRADRR